MRVILVLLSVLVLSACGANGIKVEASFNSTQDVKEGDAVYFSQNIIGEVLDVEQLSNKTQITIELNEEGAKAVKSEAAVVINRLKPELPIEIYNRRNSSESVQEGQNLQGLDSMFQLGAWKLGEAFSLGNDSLSGYVDSFQRYLQSDKFQQDKQNLEAGVKQLGKEAEGMADALGKELNTVVKDLTSVEGDAAKAIEQVGAELAPIAGEMARSGKAIIQELDKFSQNMESQSADGKEMGETVLSSLLKALETVNKSIEESVQEDNSIDTSSPVSVSAQKLELQNEVDSDSAALEKAAE